MTQREANIQRPIEKLKAIERGRRISNLTVSLILSCVVTAAAQSEGFNKEGRMPGPAPVVASLQPQPPGE
jgi:hypothetical protein